MRRPSQNDEQVASSLDRSLSPTLSQREREQTIACSEFFHGQTLTEWLARLERLHPTAIELGLERVGDVWRRLHPGPVPFKVITVGGTNGKGSSVALLEAIYRAAGYRTGCYTSPHMERFNERIRLDGQEAQDDLIVGALEAVEGQRGGISLTYFEFTTLAAFHLFSQHRLDVAILEVGLGGRLDAVNILDADVSLITSIAFDHMEWLGHDLDQIAREKAGIMRPGRPCVFNGDRPVQGLLDAAGETGARLLLRGRDYFWEPEEQGWSWRTGRSEPVREQVRSYREYPGLPIPRLRGQHQLHNAAAVLAVVESLRLDLPVSRDQVRQGLQEAFLPGRFQVIPGDIPLVLDVAHNPEAAGVFAATLAEMPCEGRTIAVFGILGDKDAAGVIAPLLDRVDHWCVAAPDTERALPVDALVEALESAGAGSVSRHGGLAGAYGHALEMAAKGDRILVFGSFYTVSAVSRLI
ncbi:MAG: bifunctional tetrahydrofolate synthase/dihydrofolate synthase [Gammaproteobacteria bacterium]|nr:bifunctional tetrahydrofolate synthase/dihydrofolate synthase [Gammaproteobacteria bacterium]MBU1653978.1 bifunctional tetrahydrofolate synthase/dihydrofolate synthase [Gammaproteobacteria bacterium]MBU1960470.1 bifunctional tetrahydrofolate synthase/dihydrofolate synthase [Gammaproteobacteria bacterium]